MPHVYVDRCIETFIVQLNSRANMFYLSIGVGKLPQKSLGKKEAGNPFRLPASFVLACYQILRFAATTGDTEQAHQASCH